SAADGHRHCVQLPAGAAIAGARPAMPAPVPRCAAIGPSPFALWRPWKNPPEKFCFYLLNEKTLEAGAGGDNWPQAPAMPFFGTKCICVGKTTAWHKTVFL